MTASQLVCEWFALCANSAAGTVKHPVLGSVPTCERCRAMFDMAFEAKPCPVCSHGEPSQHTCDVGQQGRYAIEMSKRGEQ